MTQKWLFIMLWILSQGASEAAQCTSRGRFPNQLEECRGYTMCINAAYGYMEYNVTCPETFIFSHIENLCTNVTSYKCLPEYHCTGVGNFVARTIENCTSFIACVEGINGMVDARWIECPQRTLFSPTEMACVNETLYDCHRISDSPNILSVVVNHVPNLSGNFSFNNAPNLNSPHALVFLLLSLFFRIKQQ